MNMSNEKGMNDSRAVYTPPVVVKISDLKQGAGAGCTPMGSGDDNICFTGNLASGQYGCWDGNSPTGGICSPNGSGAD